MFPDEDACLCHAVQAGFQALPKRNYPLQKLLAVMSELENEIPLPPIYKEHSLQGEYAGSLECHIEPDWLLIYQIDDDIREVYFVRTGTHSDLF
ncbi:MAG: type II toxin-antitoxin system YafQ family toxin [Synergistaceae bacterium]|jgi:mRNA interferase YafQ|nr:type II toxin-antitoxin system YafQ family toxin [Synergistaceae bacterium]